MTLMRFGVTRLLPTFCLVVSLAACSSPSPRELNLRAALDAATLSLGDSVAVAESSITGGLALGAALLVDGEPVYSIRTLGGTAVDARVRDVRVDIASGTMISSGDLGGGSAGPCAISLAEAIAIAEAEVGGAAVSAGADDDEACGREIQVLVDTQLWEVEVAGDGTVLETEHSDDD